MNDFIQYIHPALLILVPVLYIVGLMLKSSKAVKDNRIPGILGGLSVLLSVIWVLATSPIATPQNVLLAVFTAFAQGVLCAGAAVYTNQLIKQSGEDK